MCRYRIFIRPILKQIPVNITGRISAFCAQIKVIVVMSMPTAPHGLNMNECRPSSLEENSLATAVLAYHEAGSDPSIVKKAYPLLLLCHPKVQHLIGERAVCQERFDYFGEYK